MTRTHDRPWSTRIWFTRPQWHWFGWRTLVPVLLGADEYDWHCITLGWTITGRLTIALAPCSRRDGLWGQCSDLDELPTRWPISNYTLDGISPSYAAELRRILNEDDTP